VYPADAPALLAPDAWLGSGPPANPLLTRLRPPAQIAFPALQPPRNRPHGLSPARHFRSRAALGATNANRSLAAFRIWQMLMPLNSARRSGEGGGDPDRRRAASRLLATPERAIWSSLHD
jgi:hypothetical protein